MKPKRALPPIQLAPFKPFTLRLVDGHFVRIPKAENLPATDATRPSAEPLPEAADKQAPTQIPPMPIRRKPDPSSWSYPFQTRVGPSDPPSKP